MKAGACGHATADLAGVQQIPSNGKPSPPRIPQVVTQVAGDKARRSGGGSLLE